MAGFREGCSRRRALQLGGGIAMPILTGCTGQSQGPPSPSSGNSVIRDVRFDGGDMVVKLRGGHDVERLGLVAPDGSTFAQTEVASSATEGRLQALSIESGGGDFVHYTPGRYELRAVGGSAHGTLELSLEPSLRIMAITPFEGGPKADGKLAVTVENSGTGPTWIYDITYRQAPNKAANVPLLDNPGAPQLSSPAGPNAQILPPNGEQQYVGTTNPLEFTDQEEQQCSRQYSFSVIVGPAVGNPLSRNVRVQVRGQPQSIGPTGEYTCSEMTIEMEGTESDG